jgi:hypothetical protein
MGFLDRFKPQPRWRHPDSAVRAAAVDALPDEDQELLRSIASEDPDPQVRRAALARLTDPGTLARLAREDTDDGVRAEAREMAVAMARDATDEAEGQGAVEGLSDSRELAIVARTAELVRVALLALSRLSEPRVIAVVARQAGHAAVRAAALARLDARDDLLAVAVKTEHKDVAIAALERLRDQDALELVAQRARNKMAARRARAALRAMEEAERIPQQLASRRLALCEQVESLRLAPDLAAAAVRLQAAEAEWQELESSAPDEQRERFAAAAADVRALLARNEAERAEHERRAQALAAVADQAAAGRIAVCERVEALEGDEAAAGLDEARTLWVALTPWPEPLREAPQARELDARFARGCAGVEQRLARAAERAAKLGMLQELAGRAEEAAALADPAEARMAFAPLRQQWHQVGGPSLDPELAARFTAAEQRLGARDAELREARQREAAANLGRLERLASQLEALVAAPEPTLKALERAVRDARAALDHPGPLPNRHAADRLFDRIRQAHGALGPRLQELRDAEEWRRWANAGVQEQLCARAEALASVEDAGEVARQLRELQAEWKKVGAAPQERAEPLWQRFRQACDATRARVDTHFAGQREQQIEHLRAKLALCEQAEALADSTDWINTADELKRLQAEWQKIGPVPHEQAKVTWDRFRGACDRFFTRRKTDLAQRKQAWADHLKKKEAICARVEELSQSTDWEAAIAEIKQLQAEWKAIGPVKKTKSEALWQRFRAACDTFFDRYKHRDQIEISAQVDARETLCGEMEALAAPPEGDAAERPAGEVVSAMLDIWQRWQHAPRVPRGVMESLEARLMGAMGRVLEASPERFRGTRLDLDANLKRMEQLCVQVEGVLNDLMSPGQLASREPQALAALLKDALASNTIGGRVDEEAKRRNAIATVRDAQASWRRLGPVPTDQGRQLAARFHRACRRFFEEPSSAGVRPTHA